MKIITWILLFFFVIQNTFAAVISGTVDTSFNIGTGFNDQVKAIAEQSDGKLLVGGLFSTYNGYTTEKLARLNANGSFDSSFNIGVGFNGLIRSVVPLSDGKILVGGQFTTFNGNTQYPYLLRLNSDGTLDTTFTRGLLTDYVTSIYVYGGKIYITGVFVTYNGNNSRYIARLNSDGSFDNTFNVGTKINGAINGMVVDSNGKVIIVGSFNLYGTTSSNRIARLNTDGTLDSTFNIGTGFNNTPSNIILSTNNSVIVGGLFNTYNNVSTPRLVRILSTGLIDTTYNVGTGLNGTTNAIVNTASGVVAGGLFTTYKGVEKNRIVGTTSTGATTSELNFGSGFNAGVNSIIVDNRGRLVIGGLFNDYNGYYYNGIIRLLFEDSTVDTPPTDTTLSKDNIDEFNTNLLIGNLSSTGSIGGSGYTFMMNCTNDGGDEDKFTVSGSQLYLKNIPNATTQNAYSICIKSISSNNMSLDKNFIIIVNDLPPAELTLSYPQNNAYFNNNILIFTGAAQNNTNISIAFSGQSFTGSSDSIGNFNVYTNNISEGNQSILLRTFDAGGFSTGIILNLTFDYTKPNISIIGSENITLYKDDMYTDSGVTVIDNIDGDITSFVVKGGTFVDTSNVGSYTITYTATDKAGNSDSKTRNINILPPLDVDKPTASIEYSISGTTNQDVIATLVNPSEHINITSIGGDQHTFNNNGFFTFEFSDDSGNTGSTTANVTWIDKDIPYALIEYSNTQITNQNVIAYLTGISENIIITNATGVVQENGLIYHEFDSNNEFLFTFTDIAGNTGEINSIVNNIDKEKPIITLNGNTELFLYVNDIYNDLGATANDNIDGNISNLISTGGTYINTSSVGDYTITYSVQDTAGNHANVVTRTIHIQNTSGGGGGSGGGDNGGGNTGGGNGNGGGDTTPPPPPPPEPPVLHPSTPSSSVGAGGYSQNEKRILSPLEDKYRPGVLLNEIMYNVNNKK